MPVPAGGDSSTDLYTDLPTVKSALGKITVDDRDELIEASIRAACRQIDRKTGRYFYTDAAPTARTVPVVGQSLYAAGEQVLLVPDIATDTGLAVAAGATGNWAAVTGWETGPDNALVFGRPITEIRSYAGWLPTTGRMQVTAVWGWPAVPDEIAEAAKLLAARLYRRKDSPQGVLGTSEWGTARVSRTDPDVESLIAPFVIPAVA
jgi:hypothetical protein